MGMSDGGEAPGLEFPCRLPIKAMGRSDQEFSARVAEVVGRHATVEADAVRVRDSRAGNFQSVTITVDVDSRERMEAIYRDLAALEEVLWTL